MIDVRASERERCQLQLAGTSGDPGNFTPAQWAALLARDPAALAWSGDTVVEHTNRRALEMGEDEVDTLGEGMPELALCDLGAVCGADSQAALSVCVTVGACDGDLRERLLSSAAAMPERERMQREARQLGEAVRSGASARYGLRCRVVWCRPVTARAGAPLASGSTPLSGGRCLGAQRKASASAAW